MIGLTDYQLGVVMTGALDPGGKAGHVLAAASQQWLEVGLTPMRRRRPNGKAAA
jgi:hypothetical protein